MTRNEAPEAAKGQYEREDYSVLPHHVQHICQEFGVEPQMDLFARKENARFHQCYTAAEDALQQDWPSGVLWCNPPWSIWPEVVSKIIWQECTVFCIVPGWSCDWVRALLALAVKKIYFEQGVIFFEVEGRACSGVRWPVWALLVVSTGDFDEKWLESVQGVENCKMVPRWAATPTQRRRRRKLQVKKKAQDEDSSLVQ